MIDLIARIALGVIFFTLAEVPMSAAEPSVQERNKEAVGKAFESWRGGTGNVFDLLEPDATWTIVGNAPVSRTYGSKQEFLDVVLAPFNARMSQRLVPKVRELFADGDTVIALFDADGIARDGKPYHNTYTWYMRMRAGRIIDVVAVFDTIVFTDLWTRVVPGDNATP